MPPFFGRSCKDTHRIFGHIGQDKRAILLLLSLCWEYVTNTNMICVYQKKRNTIIAAFITIGGGLFVSDIHLHISFMVSILVVWSWITIHVYSGTNVKRNIEDLEFDMAGKWALRLVLIIESFGHARVDESGPIILLLPVRMAVILLRILIYFRPVILFRMTIKGAISCR